MQKQTIKKLYILQVKGKGIREEDYKKLAEEEKRMLELRGERWWLKEEFRKKIRVVATGGVFDVIHIGHVKTLKKAKSYGDVLVVVVARDEMVRKKGRVPAHSLEERVELVSSLRFVDLALAGGDNVTETAELISPDVVVFGYDQKPFEVKGAEVVKLDNAHRPENIKTGKLIREGVLSDV